MALKDIEVGTAMPADKQYKLTDGNGMHLFVHPNGSKYGDPTPVATCRGCVQKHPDGQILRRRNNRIPLFDGRHLP